MSDVFWPDGWPKDAELGDFIEAEPVSPDGKLVLPGHYGYYEKYADQTVRNSYGGDYDVHKWVRKELWCSCKTKVMHNAKDASFAELRTYFLWHVMEHSLSIKSGK